MSPRTATTAKKKSPATTTKKKPAAKRLSPMERLPSFRPQDTPKKAIRRRSSKPEPEVSPVRLGLAQLEGLFHDFLNLKKLRRTGWQLRGIRDCESLADHCFGTALLTLFLAPFVAGLDRDRAVRLALVHELGECRVGDIPFPALAYLKGKSEAELAAVADVLAPLGAPGAEYRDLFVEFEEKSSPEARFVRAIDKLEMLITALEYEKTGFTALGDFWENEATFSALTEFPALAKLGQGLLQQHNILALRTAIR